MCLRRGAAVTGSARRRTARGGAGALPASGCGRVCTGCRDARAAAPALGTLAPGGGGLGAAGAGLMAPWEAFAHRCDAGAAFASEGNPEPWQERARRVGFWRSAAASSRCGARLGVAAARRGGFGVGAASDGARRGVQTLRRAVGVCALAAAARALLRRLSGRLRRVGAGSARLARAGCALGRL